MSSAFKNFFITFTVCLVIFGILGVQVGGLLSDLVSNIGKKPSNTPSGVVSSDTSDTTSQDVSQAPVVNNKYWNEHGDIFTAVVMCVDENDRVVNCVFIDANGKTNQYIYCVIPVTAKMTNEIGNPVPIESIFGKMTPQAICDCITAMTGIKTDYCFRFQKNDMGTIASMIPGASVVLSGPVTVTLPSSEPETFPPADGIFPDVSEGGAAPVQSTLTIENDAGGKVLLNEKINEKTKLQWLLESEADTIGVNQNKLYCDISKALMRQFFEQKTATKKTSVLTKLASISDTNFTANAAAQHLDAIFSHNQFDYHSYTYPSNWQAGVIALREFDGRFDR